jgi:N-acetyl-anhydromuramyl-L-alanine amidase AmpD
MTYALATWYPSDNYGYPKGTHGRQGHNPIAIVNHVAQGSRAGMRAVVRTGNASTHYFVGKDGLVDQYVLESDAAWGNGLDFDAGYDAYRSDRAISWIDDCWNQRLNPNLVTVSVEHEGFSGTPLTPAQYNATLDLHKHLIARYGIRPDAEHIIGHNKIDAVNRPRDPGPAFPWARLLDDLNLPAPAQFDYELTRAALDELWAATNTLSTTAEAMRRAIIRIKQLEGYPD